MSARMQARQVGVMRVTSYLPFFTLNERLIMQSLLIKAEIKKSGVITQHDRHMLCLQLIKSIMSMPTQEIINVPQVSQQGQSQASSGITQEQRSFSYA
jgi:hypothetical protein